MSEFHDEYYKSFKIEVKLFKYSNPLVIRDVDDNIEEWVYSVKPPKELELLHGSHGFFFHTTYGDPTPTQAIANAKAKIDEVLGKKIGQLRADLEVLEKFNDDQNKDDDFIRLKDESCIHTMRLVGSFGQVDGPDFSGEYKIEWKVIKE